MIGVIIQARSGSSRFPRKIFEDINGKNTLQRVLEGVTSAKVPHSIILAMPTYDKDEFESRERDAEFDPYTDDRFDVYFGHPEDLLDRYYDAANQFGLDLIVRVTADCPLVQGKIIDEMLLEYLKNGYNGFMGNNSLVSSSPYPDGTDVEIFPYWMLAETYQMTKDPHDREHVTPYMYRRGTSYKIHQFYNCRPNVQINMKHEDFSFDTPEDLVLIKAITKEYDKHGDLNKAISDVSVKPVSPPPPSPDGTVRKEL